MHPGIHLAEARLGRPLEEGDLDFSPGRLAMAGAVILGIAGTALGGAYGVGAISESMMENRANTMPVVMDTMQASMIAHAQGIESGMIINGIVIPEALSERIAALATDDLSAQVDAAMDMRHAGMEEALDGVWSVGRLNGYIERIEQFEPAVSDMMQGAIAQASDLPFEPDRIERLVKLHVVSELLQANDRAERQLDVTPNETNADFIAFGDIMRDMRSGIAERLGGLEAIGQLNRQVMTEMALDAMQNIDTAPETETDATVTM